MRRRRRCGTDARRGHAPVPHRALRQPERVAPLRPRRPARRRRGPRPRRRRHRLPPRRGRVHRRRHGERQRRHHRGRVARAASCARRPSTTPCCTPSSAHGGTVVAGRRGRPRRARRASPQALGPDVAVVSVMAVNNEVGSITDLAAVAALVRRHAPSAVAAHRRRPGGLLARPARALAARRPAVAQRPQVRRSQGRRRAGRPGGHGPRAADRRRRSGARAAQRHAQRRRHRRPGRGARRHRRRADGRDRRASPSLRDRLVAGISAAVPGVRETVPPAAKVAGSAHVLFEDVESEALLYLLDRGRRLRLGRVGLRQRGDGTVPRARRDGRRAAVGDGRAAPEPRAARPPPPTSTTPSPSSPPR